ncbi:MAG: helix-turn-helix domain-containing protein [Ignavibacteriae bacterium]|nr:helix-turn-helix domain-containing protein [Ignavibacteriota bacterium]
MLKIILEKPGKIELMLKEQSVQLMVFNDVCNYLNISRSHLYKLTSASLIPHYKPSGKMLYFKKSEIDDWALRNRVKTNQEIDALADEYMREHSRKG